MSSLRTPPSALLLLLMTAFRDSLAAPDITMSIRGAGWPSASVVGGGGGGGGDGIGTVDGNGPNSLTINQVHTLISSIEFRLRDLSNTIRRDQQAERINSRIDLLFNKLNNLEVSNGMWFDKFQQAVVEECGQNHMTRRLDKAQQQQEITLEHMEITLETVQNHQKELEKEMKKVADRQTELFAEIQYMRKDMSSEFVKHNSSHNDFRKQLQETVANLSQQSKMTEKSSNPCSCNQNDDPSQMPDTMTTAKLVITVNNMYNGLKERSDDMRVILKELLETIGSHQQKLDSDRHMINEFTDSFLETIVGDIAAIQKKSEIEFESKLKKPLQSLVDSQKYFMDNCHRLQLNERQIENDMITILERIFDHIDNKSTFDSTVLEQISKTLNIQGNLEEKMFGELLELSKAQTDQVTRTVAYSTNQVIKLHQDITDISYTLKGIKYIAPNGHEPSNTTNVSNGVNVSIHNTTQNSNPLTTKTRPITEKSLVPVPTDKLSNRGKSTIIS